MPPSELGCPPISEQGSQDSGYRDVVDPRYAFPLFSTPIYDLYDILRLMVALSREPPWSPPRGF
jgi:hypothetical protein